MNAVDILGSLERRLEKLVDAVFGAAPPVSMSAHWVAKAVADAAEENLLKGLKTSYVPNVYRVLVAPEDFQVLGSAAGHLERELRDFVRDYAADLGYSLAGPVIVRLVPAEVRALKVETMVREGQPPAELTVVAGPDEGTAFRIQAPLGFVGRGADNQMVLTDSNVSRRHCEIRFVRDQFWVVDLGSTNGTLVNGQPVQSAVLSDGDQLELGTTVLTFRIAE